MDHHCVVLGKCIGNKNKILFKSLLLLSISYILYSLFAIMLKIGKSI